LIFRRRIIATLDHEMLREVGTLSRCVQSISDIKFRDLGLQKGQFVFLTRICENPGINLVDLSRLLKVDKTTTTKAIRKLADSGYVERERDEADGRSWLLTPTRSAKTAYAAIIRQENQYIETCFKGFNAREKSIALDLVRRMRTNIEDDWRMAKSSKGGEDE
jgi:DNA-binding MarR family transcriptional regulator